MKDIPSWFKKIFSTKNSDKWVTDRNLLWTIDEVKISQSQFQTAESFGYQWSRRDLFDQDNAQDQVKEWLIERYGLPKLWVKEGSIILDAGCGAGQSIIAYLGKQKLKSVNYIGCDISSAVQTARIRFEEQGIKDKIFIRSDINKIPVSRKSVDVIFSEGVLHHTDNAKSAFKYLSGLLKSNGYFIFYIYRKKAPIREFTDDFIREALKGLSPEEKFSKILSLTKLGQSLGDLNIKIKIHEPIEILKIPAGEIDIQRLFFYYIFKCFYKQDWSLEQMNLTNFDWYSPQNCSRHTQEEVRSWLSDNNFEIEREYVDASGLSYVAIKK